MKVSIGSEIIGRQWKNHSNKRNSPTIYPLVKSRPFGSNFWFGEDIVIQQRNLEMKWFFNKFPYLHRQFYKVQWSYGAKRTLLSCFFGISSNSENMNCSVCDEWLEMIQKYHPRWRLQCSEKTKSFNLKIPQPDSERRHRCPKQKSETCSDISSVTW